MDRAGLSLLVSLLVMSTAGPARAQVPMLRTVQELEITGDFNHLGSLAVDQQGRIAALDSRDARLYLFEASGREVARAGRQGSGPGEFVRPGSMGSRDGGWWVADPMTARVTLFTPALALEGSQPIPTTITGTPASAAVGRGMPTVRGIGRDGSLLLASTPPASDQASRALFPLGKSGTLLLAANNSGVFIRLIGAVAPAPQCVVAGPNRTAATVPLCTEALYAVSSDGLRAAFVRPQVGERPAYQLTLLGLRGDTLIHRIVPYAPETIPRGVGDTLFAPLRKLNGAFKPPTRYPPALRVIAGRDGTVWVEEGHAGAQHRWALFDARGVLVGRVMLSEGFRLTEADRNRLWAVARDGDGVQSIVRHRLTGEF